MHLFFLPPPKTPIQFNSMFVQPRNLNLFPSPFLSTRAAENSNTMGGTDSTVLPLYNPYPQVLLRDFNFNHSDLSSQQQLEADGLISAHMERVRLEMEERRMMQSLRVIGAIEEAAGKMMKEKDDQIESICKHNKAMGDRIRSLYNEMKIWQNMARANQAAAVSLQSNLDQILAQQIQINNNMEDDAGSCCGSNEEEEGKRMMMMCKVCGGKESCVLVLPCRHLCVCTDCGASVKKCPLCNSTNNATLLVHFS